MNAKQTEKQEAIEDLRKMLKPGDTVYTILRSVSRSGMSRTLDVYILQDNEPRRITWTAALAAGFTYDRKAEALKVGGCGMDVGFEVVYNLGYALFPDGFNCIGQGCPSNDHSNDHMGINPNRVVSTGESMVTGLLGTHDPARKHSESGYALRHRWM